MPGLQISLLGSFQITHDQQGEVPFTNRKVMGLLAFLALEADQAHSRETLMGLLWPAMSEADARNNLRVTLARLRKLLEGVTAVSPLITSRTDVRFRPDDSVTLDATDFQALLAQTEDHAHAERGACVECRQRLATAAALYHGPLLHGLFLDDCPAFDEWLFVQRERFHLQALEVLEELAQGLEADGRYAEALTPTRRQLELDPLHDSAQRRLLRLLAYQGQTTAALGQFASIKKTLHAELGIEPDVELLQLAQQIKGGTLPMPGPRAAKTDTSREATAVAGTAVAHHNLPEILTPFIGRERELAQLTERLAAPLNGPAYRMITLAGPGGIGKTRLALEAARANLHRFADGAFFVPLDGVAQAFDIPAAIASALNVTFSSDAAPAAELLRILQEKQLLLVVDNLEHIIEEGAALLLQIVQSAPQVVLLITSRERLNVQAEDLFRLHGLPYPDDANGEAGHYAAVRLFADRAHRLQKTFRLSDETLPHVAHICRLVEGLPLGLELAATWVRDFSVAQIADSLAENIDLLATDLRDISPRHRSLAAVFEYSWQLLTAGEQTALSQLAVFRGSFTPAAAGQVANAPPLTLTRLRYKSLVRSMGNGRYSLHQLTQQFAAEKLAEMGETVVYQEHAAHFLNLVAAQSEALAGAQPQQAIGMVQLDLDNVRQAWRWGTTVGYWKALHHSVAGLSRFYHAAGLNEEGAQMMGQALDALPVDAEHALRLDLLLEQTGFIISQAKLSDAISQAEAAVTLAQQLDDSVRLGRAFLLLGRAHSQTGDLRRSCSELEAGLTQARRGQDLALEAEILRYLGTTLQSLNERQLGENYLQQALQIMRDLGNRTQEQAILLYLAVNHIEMNEYARGRPYLEEALHLIQATGNRPLESRIQNALGFVNAALGQLEAALPYHDRSRQIAHEIGEPFQESHAYHNLCTVNRKLGRLELAEQCGREALRLGQQYNLADPISYAWLHLGYLFRDQGKFDAAFEAFVQAQVGWQALEMSGLTIEATAGMAGALWRQGKAGQALKQVAVVLDLLEQAPLQGVDEPFEIYLACYQVLNALYDSRAASVLQQADAWLQRLVAAIDNPETRASFLNNVPVNRQLQTALQQASAAETPAPPPIRPQTAAATTDPRHRFVVQGMLAVGGQGELHLGHDRLTEKPVVIKQLKTELLARNPELVQRLIQEGEILRRLNHPNVVQMLAAYEMDGVHHIVMEYVPGGTLRDLLNQTHQLSLPQTLAIGLELADALSRAHHLNVIHRDIKPDNVLLAADGTPRLTDFGVARLMEKGGAGLTKAGALIGSPAYMSPEVLRGEPPDARSDIWSFGILLFEMLAGFHPYDDRNEQVTAVLIKILNDPPPDLWACCPDAPPALLELLQKMLVKERNGRIASMRQVAAALEEIRGEG